MHPKKKWGQHFLRNRGAVEKIVAAVEPRPGETIVEIGPGEGVLTDKLAALGNDFQAIEIDPELASRLRTRFGDVVINDDALTAPLPLRPFRAVGNLPYNVGTPILRRVIAHPHFRRGVFMLQKEVADRLVAKPRDEQYGFLTLFAQLFTKARTLLTLDRRSFHPPPKVRSAVVVLDADRKPYASDEMIELLSTSFRMRRKKLINNLIGRRGLTRDDALAAMRRANIGEGARAEELALDDFARLRAELHR